MANTVQAKKRARQAEKARQHNMGLRSKVRTAVKKVKMAIAAGDLETARQSYKAAVPIIDGMVNKRIIHKNTAARYKSNLNIQLKKAAAAA